MKYFYFLLLGIMLSATPASSQFLEPQIKFKLYVQDAIGNKDSVTIGYDSLAYPGIDTAFGEVNLRYVPFDSVFEVRGADKSGFEYQSKPTLHWYTPLMCNYNFSQYQSIIIRAKHFPVTISWDSTYFHDDCYDWTHLTRIWSYLFNPSFVNGDIAKLRDYSSVTFTKLYQQQTNGFMNNRIELIEGGGQDSVYVIWVGLAANMPTNSTFEAQVPVVKSYPNPVSDWLSLDIEVQEQVHIQSIMLTDGLGRNYSVESWHSSHNGISFSLTHVPAGIYTGTLYSRGGQAKRFKLVKI
ncbi:MAG: hypothetical protein ACOYNO_10735 [Saprospiraceae bacterium]